MTDELEVVGHGKQEGVPRPGPGRGAQPWGSGGKGPARGFARPCEGGGAQGPGDQGGAATEAQGLRCLGEGHWWPGGAAAMVAGRDLGWRHSHGVEQGQGRGDAWGGVAATEKGGRQRSGEERRRHGQEEAGGHGCLPSSCVGMRQREGEKKVELTRGACP